MEIKTLAVSGLEPAMEAMRNPLNSWDRSDSCYLDADVPFDAQMDAFMIGQNDRDLSLRLQKAGPEHCKHLRMVYVWVDIIASRFWWQEADTYRFGVEKVSCSTMHKMMARPLTIDDFEHSNESEIMLEEIIQNLNERIIEYKRVSEEDPAEAKLIWRSVIELLPQSYLQKRTVCMSYAALRNIVRQREGHKLREWRQFIEWAKTLPESWMIFDKED